jgi:hypothetical protein
MRCYSFVLALQRCQLAAWSRTIQRFLVVLIDLEFKASL